jgi:hypothetical protein
MTRTAAPKFERISFEKAVHLLAPIARQALVEVSTALLRGTADSPNLDWAACRWRHPSCLSRSSDGLHLATPCESCLYRVGYW